MTTSYTVVSESTTVEDICAAMDLDIGYLELLNPGVREREREGEREGERERERERGLGLWVDEMAQCSGHCHVVDADEKLKGDCCWVECTRRMYAFSLNKENLSCLHRLVQLSTGERLLSYDSWDTI